MTKIFSDSSKETTAFSGAIEIDYPGDEVDSESGDEFTLEELDAFERES